jgi:hypothetical protein
MYFVAFSCGHFSENIYTVIPDMESFYENSRNANTMKDKNASVENASQFKELEKTV